MVKERINNNPDLFSVRAARKALSVYFAGGVFGDKEMDTPEKLASYWGYVDSMVAIGITERRSQGIHTAPLLQLDDEILQSVAFVGVFALKTKALKILSLLPPSLDEYEWHAISANANQLLLHPTGVLARHVSQEGMSRLKSQQQLGATIRNRHVPGQSIFEYQVRSWLKKSPR